jgi:hypothetical protein
MGSYAAQTSEEERWKITHYVMNLKNELEGGEEIPFEEEKEASIAETNPVEVERAQQNAEESQGEGAAQTLDEENNN